MCTCLTWVFAEVDQGLVVGYQSPETQEVEPHFNISVLQVIRMKTSCRVLAAEKAADRFPNQIILIDEHFWDNFIPRENTGWKIN